MNESKPLHWNGTKEIESIVFVGENHVARKLAGKAGCRGARTQNN